MNTTNHYHRTSRRAVLLLILLVGVALAGAAWIVHSARQPTWSEHTAGPLTCVSNGPQMQCAVRHLAIVPEAHYLPQSGELSAQQLGCIALAVFSESRGESYLGQAAVAQVVLNRAEQAGRTPCDAVTQVAEFQAVEQLSADPWRIDAATWQRPLGVAEAVATRDFDAGACATATAFYGITLPRPEWATALKVVCRVGRHQFLAGAQS